MSTHPRNASAPDPSRPAAPPAEEEERRRGERRTPVAPSVAVVHEGPDDAGGGTVGSHFFVELHDISDRGACFICDRAFPVGRVLDVLIHDPHSNRWTRRQAETVWCRPHSAPGLHQAGLRFRTSAAAPDDAPWRPDPERPHTADLTFLTGTGLLASLPRQSLCPLLNCLRSRRLDAGARLIRQGEEGSTLYLIASGECAVRVEKDGTMLETARLRAGDVVGEMAVLTGEPRTAHVDACTPLLVWELRRDDFERVSALYPDLRVLLTEIISRRFETSPSTADRVVGKFVIRRPLGQGGWSLVYHGEHGRLHFPVAIKMMRHNLAMDPEFLASFRKEAEIIAPMTHPNIVRVYDVEERYRTVFIVMEHLEGESLERLLKRQGSLPPQRAVRILEQVCAGLAYAHAHGIVHRDIKPANIFLQRDDQVKILDFGLACPRGTEDMSLAGTVKYAPPEQIEGLAVDGRSDLYALGVMAWELVAGRRPWPEDDLMALMRRHCEEDLPDPAEAVSGLPEGLRRFIRTAGARAPERRQPTAEAALHELEAVAATLACADGPRPGLPTGCRDVRFSPPDAAHAAALDRLLEETAARAQALGIAMRALSSSDPQGSPPSEAEQAGKTGEIEPDITARQHTGLVRSQNQDRALVRYLPDGRILLAVADGMGGEAGGDQAADMVRQALVAFQPEAERDDDAPAADLDRAVRRVSEAILAAGQATPDLTGMGSTVVAALLFPHEGALRAEWLNLGDSRLYLRRGGALLRVTHDHSFLADLLDSGELTEAEARMHPMRHVLDQCAGTPDATPDTGRLDLEPGDVLLLCSDGLHAQVPDVDIARALEDRNDARRAPRAETAARRLVSLALAAGGADNITVVVARIPDRDEKI